MFQLSGRQRAADDGPPGASHRSPEAGAGHRLARYERATTNRADLQVARSNNLDVTVAGSCATPDGVVVMAAGEFRIALRIVVTVATRDRRLVRMSPSPRLSGGASSPFGRSGWALYAFG
jgi:hypothetical protein